MLSALEERYIKVIASTGAYQSKTLGVATIEYLPYAFLNYINPIVSIVMTVSNLRAQLRRKVP